jgi:hypothetical protein
MKFIRALILILLFVLIGLGGYYVYLVFNPLKQTENANGSIKNTPVVEETTPFEYVGSTHVPKITDLKSLDFTSSGDTVKIQGSLQAVDSAEKTINNVLYSYVLGILDDNGDLSKIWITANEYEVIKQDIPLGWGIPGIPVVVTLSRNGVTLEKNLPN